MPNQRISELTEDTSALLSDFIPVVSLGSTVTRKINLARILSLGGGGSGGAGGGNMLDTFTINVPGNPFSQNGHTVNIGDSISALLKLILAPAISAVISAGVNQTVGLFSGLTIALTAAETPGSSPIVTRLWSILSGPAGLSITNAGGQSATLTGFTASSAGTYQIKYQTWDAAGTEVDAMVSEVVLYNPPVISVSGINIQLPATSGSLAASTNVSAGSYAIQSVVYSLVTQPGGSSAAVSGSGAFSGFNVAGAYVCNVLVTDVNGHTASMNIPVNVAAAAVQPVTVYYGTQPTGETLSQTDIENESSAIQITPGASQYTIPYPGAGTTPRYHWFAEPATEPVKTSGVDTLDSTNTFAIGTSDDTFGPPVIVGPYRFYITTYKTALNPTIIKE